ncbi:shikimate dehydrogenase [Domibacillus sp. DTU_2020_1001157_1_SI_ALB_TIR_016]|uniref:shikimate dehydrogenase n=1 Tax=Domibacillus sp. DTU_2020_1001157_1_SI_ALB_TIR_016 TaxID=3077789 RepID=UPI0028E6B574|nr:shikimate dehydrogenase [Domibacillus sp. DTU_2020_1001157_1_SI_ALB_TIR_016]WNS81891.1 shikimate dehydrogenase [Domibacillus sp. DTU_2020_1001157_1_SI_ALB_TIR_016]
MKKLYGVIGDPIGHSMSPDMHNDAFGALHMEAYYHPFHIKSEELKTAVAGMKAIGLSGFNVTVPHKTAIMPLLDEIDPLAEAIGAVNTVVRDENRFIGYNTDGEGFVRGLNEEYGSSVLDKKIMIIGAGGAARAIYYTLSQQGAERVDIANRTPAKAEELKSRCPYPVETALLSLEQAEEQLGDYDIIIQTTSIGMSPKVSETPIHVKNIRPDAFVSDIIYNPAETMIMKEAKKRGARVQNGLKMFAYQGALAFEKWTGILPDTERMQKIVQNKLGGTSC